MRVFRLPNGNLWAPIPIADDDLNIVPHGYREVAVGSAEFKEWEAWMLETGTTAAPKR